MREAGRAGWTLVELLFASSIFLIVGSVALQLVGVSQSAFRFQPEAADVQQRLRVAVDAIAADLRQAGAGPVVGDAAGPLFRLLPPVRPGRRGLWQPDGEFAARSDGFTVLWVPPGAPQTTLRSPMRSPGDVLEIDTARAGCVPDGACGFKRGDRALVLDARGVGMGYDIFTVTGAGAGLLWHESPNRALSRAYESDTSWVMAVVQYTYYRDGSSNRLMRYDGWMSDVPLVDDVIGFEVFLQADPDPWSVPPPEVGESSCLFPEGGGAEPSLSHLGGTAPRRLDAAELADGPVCGQAPNRFDGDLLRVRSVRIRIGLQAASDGAAADSGQTAMRPHRPPVWVTFDVSLRNALAGRPLGGDPSTL